MPNTPTARKRMKQIAKRTQINKAVKSRMKTAMRRFEESLKRGDAEEAHVNMKKAVRMIDKAVAKGVIHKNNAARKKSQLMRKFSAFQQEKAS